MIGVIVMGQSEEEYLLNTDAFYRQITQPTPGDGNLIVFTQNGNGVEPVRTIVNATTVAAGQVNPAMAALSAFLEYVYPGQTWCIGDGAVAGTARWELVDDSSSARLFSDFEAVVNAIIDEADEVKALVECWYNADAARIVNFKTNFWPMYFGANADGSTFTLGNASGGGDVDHCMWDADALDTEVGRGIFRKDTTEWHLLTPMPFWDIAVDPSPELTNFSQGDPRLSEPNRATLIALADDTLAQSVNLTVGPSAHLCRFGGTSTEIHPDVGTADGQILLMWPIAISMLRTAGFTIGEPTIVGIEGPEDGTYADVLVDLPNGGTLTTLRTLRAESAPSPEPPHYQEVIGFEVTRGSTRRPVFKESETSYPIAHRGTVEIINTGSGSPRRGKVRITPEAPFAFGNAVSYLRGQATAGLLEPRDIDALLYKDMLIEHIPSYYDDSALYPFEGIPVRPYQADLTVTVPAPSFTPRGAAFNGSTYYASDSISVAATGDGLLSLWLKNDDSAWNATTRRPLSFRISSTIVLELQTASSGRITFRLNNNTATDTLTVYAAQPGNVQFALGQWYHIMASWSSGTVTVYVNGVSAGTISYTTLDMSSTNLTRIGIGAQSTGVGGWLGDLAHLYLNLSETLDLSVQANREKFALSGSPVDLGGDGSAPTGTAPEYYYDGDESDWNNKGTAGNVSLTGSLTASTTTPSY
jgi:hypothetical protein